EGLLHAHALDGLKDAAGGVDGDGLQQPMETDAFAQCVLVFEAEGGDLGGGAAVEDRDTCCAKAHGGDGGVDGRVARADDGDVARNVGGAAGLVALDQVQRVDDRWMAAAWEVERMRFAQADADEDVREGFFQIGDGDVPADLDVEAELDAQVRDE